MDLLIIKNKGVTDATVKKCKETLNKYLTDKFVDRGILSKPFEILFSEMDVDIDVKHKLYGTNVRGRKVYGSSNVKSQLRKIVPENKYQGVYFIYDNEYFPTDGYVAAFTTYTPLFPETEYVELPDKDARDNTAIHEMGHMLVNILSKKGYVSKDVDQMDMAIVDGENKPYYKNNFPGVRGGNYDLTFSAIDPYLKYVRRGRASILQSLLDKLKELQAKQSKKTYKWFSDKEVKDAGLTDEFMKLLDGGRDHSGTSWVITSGYRDTTSGNHGTREAADIRCTGSGLYKLVKYLRDNGYNSVETYAIIANIIEMEKFNLDKQALIVRGAIKMGIKRIGVYDKHCHLDIVKGKAEPTIWYGKSE